MKGWTIKPCEGCGSVNGRNTGKLCRECQSLINDGVKWQEHKEKLECSKLIKVAVPDNWERPRFDSHIHSHETKIEDSLGKAFRMLSHLLLEGGEKPYYAGKESFVLFKKVKKKDYMYQGKKETSVVYKDRAYEFVREGFMNREVAGLLHRLWSQTNKLLVAREKNAYEYGGNMLKRIVQGKATVQDFEDKL